MKLLDRIADVRARLHLAPATVSCYQRWVRMERNGTQLVFTSLINKVRP